MDPVKVRKVNMSDFLESMKRIKKSIASDNLGKMATCTVKIVWRFSYPQPAGNNLIIPAQGEFGSYIPSGDGNIDNLFLQCRLRKFNRLLTIKFST